LITLVLILRIRCGCSYGSISKIIVILQENYMEVSCEQMAIPHEKTLQNWVSKVGYYYLQNNDKQLVSQEVCLIMDISVRVGTEKLFLALVCPYEKYFEGDLSYESVWVLYLKGDTSWTGDKISEQLTEVLSQRGLTVKYIVSDEGNNLIRGARLLKLPHLADISHLVATCLKKTFSKQKDYMEFSTAVNKCQAKLAMGRHSYLRPPKQRVKARFMNQQKVVDWAETLLEKWDTLDIEAVEKLEPIIAYQQTIIDLKVCIDLANKIAIPLKRKGLSIQLIEQALALIETKLIKASDRLKTFIGYLKSYLMGYKNFITQEEWQGKRVHVCSDIIERLFGRYKSKVSDNYFVTVSTIALELPLMCLSQKELTKNVQLALEQVDMTTLKQWKNKQSADNQFSMRMKFFKK